MLAAVTDNATDALSGALVVVMIYLGVLIVLGVAGRVASREKSLGDFFLGGRNLGFIVLLLTLYATQYSGNTLIGFAGAAYRSGFAILVALPFMMAGIGFYLLYAPKLQRLSRAHNFITLGDYLQRRYQHRWLTSLIAISGIVALGNFMITNLKAMGDMTVVITGGSVSALHGIIFLSVIILIYETLGGLRSVAWTDVLQGVLLFLGCTIIFTVTITSLGGVDGAAAKLEAARPDFWVPLSAKECLGWVSKVLIVSTGFALYPQAIQRIYAARNSRTLKRSLQVMVFMPLVTTLLMVAIGLLGNIAHPGLDRASSEGITMLVLGDFAASHPAAQWVTYVFIAAVVAAIMSTADSVLLAIASSATQDLLRPLIRTDNQRHLTLYGKVISLTVMVICIALAASLPQSIWRLIQIKVELLAQTAPALVLGLHCKRLRGREVFVGFVVGTAFTLFCQVGVAMDWLPSAVAMPLGVHAGIWGLLLNVGVIFALNHYAKPSNREAAA